MNEMKAILESNLFWGNKIVVSDEDRARWLKWLSSNSPVLWETVIYSSVRVLTALIPESPESKNRVYFTLVVGGKYHGSRGKWWSQTEAKDHHDALVRLCLSEPRFE